MDSLRGFSSNARGSHQHDPTPDSKSEDARVRAVLIESDTRLAQTTARYLESQDIDVTVAADASAGIASVLRTQADVILLDVQVAGGGFELCEKLREHVDTPIIVISNVEDEADRVRLLESGGVDDYVAKPFSPRELVARMRAHIRRARGKTGPQRELRVGPLSIDRSAMRASLRDRPLVLTTYEFQLLKTLAERAGRVVSREVVVDTVRGSADEAFDRSVDIHISHLRAKLGDDPRNPRFIKTVRGAGYMLATQADD